MHFFRQARIQPLVEELVQFAAGSRWTPVWPKLGLFIRLGRLIVDGILALDDVAVIWPGGAGPDPLQEILNTKAEV